MQKIDIQPLQPTSDIYPLQPTNDMRETLIQIDAIAFAFASVWHDPHGLRQRQADLEAFQLAWGTDGVKRLKHYMETTPADYDTAKARAIHDIQAEALASATANLQQSMRDLSSTMGTLTQSIGVFKQSMGNRHARRKFAALQRRQQKRGIK